MSQKQNRNASSTHGRPSKPGLQKKGFNNNHGGQSPSSKSGSSSSKKASAGIANRGDEAEAGGMDGLPEFCATCEKQIVTPGNSILYCSEACRKKDTSFRPLSIQTALSPSANIPSAASYFDVPESDIVQQRSPTVLRPASTIFSDLSTSEPASPSDGSNESDENGVSEAARYLAQFYSQDYAGERVRPRRPRANRISSGLPSLSHTPSSSIGTMASVDRPLPRRQDPSRSQVSSKSVDLVIPSYPNYSPSSSRYSTKDATIQSSASTATAVGMSDEGSKSYQRRDLSQDDHHQTSSGLKHLFSHDSMQATFSHGGLGPFQWLNEDEPHRAQTTGL